MEDVELEFCDDVFNVIVKKVMDCKIGVCGFCLIVEVVLFDIMYDFFLMEDVSKVVIDEIVICGELKFILIYDSNEKKVVFEQMLVL